MDYCAISCQRMAAYGNTPDLMAAAERFGGLLVDLPEFQDYLRLDHAVQMDTEAQKVMRIMQGFEFDEDGNISTGRGLRDRFETLPIVIEFREVERSLRLILDAVEAAISQAAGIDFASNAQSRACG